ncbi:hypothetical protein DFS33DRAFT_569357 [Desarmillaria ectypa]|nr:hypothetical protein DFS33DRAFT_569357 [Desarmillaria ectypa]
MHLPRISSLNKLNLVFTDDRYTAAHGCPSPVSVLFNDAAWCCIIECRCSLKRRPHIRRHFGRRIRRLPKIPVPEETAPVKRVVRKLPVPPSESSSSSGSGENMRKLPVPPSSVASRSADNGVKPRNLPTPPPSPIANVNSTVRPLPTPPSLSFTQPKEAQKQHVRPLPLESFPTTPSVTCSTPLLMQTMSSRASAGGHADEMLLSPLIDWDVVMDEIIYRHSNASSTLVPKAQREEVVIHGKNGSWMLASFIICDDTL